MDTTVTSSLDGDTPYSADQVKHLTDWNSKERLKYSLANMLYLL